MKYKDLNAVIKCKCGCGKELTLQQKKWGCEYASSKCANRVKGEARKGKKRGPYKGFADNHQGRKLEYASNGLSYRGKKVCLNYDDERIECVICYEQSLFRKKACRVKGNKDEMLKM